MLTEYPHKYDCRIKNPPLLLRYRWYGTDHIGYAWFTGVSYGGVAVYVDIQIKKERRTSGLTAEGLTETASSPGED